MASMRGRNGQIVGQGFSGKKTQLGVRMTSAVKKLGCSNLKTMLEDDKLISNDYEIISELTTFAQKHWIVISQFFGCGTWMENCRKCKVSIMMSLSPSSELAQHCFIRRGSL